MDEDFREEDSIGKAYNGRLVSRLLHFAKPYWAPILAAAALIALVTGADLAPPYLSALAIDNDISAMSQPLAVYPVADAFPGGIIYNGEDYLPQHDVKGHPAQWAQLVTSHGRTYLVTGITPGKVIKIVSGEAETGGRTLPAQPLSASAANAFRAPFIHGLVLLGLIYALVVLVAFIANYVQTYILQWAGQRIIYDLRKKIFTHIEHMHLGYFDKNPIGRLVTRVTNDSEALNEMYTSVLVNIFKDIFMLVGAIVIMFTLNHFLAYVSYAIIPLLIVTTAGYTRYARDAYRTVRVRLARLNAFLSENFSGMRIVQVMRQEMRQQRRFDVDNRGYLKAGIRELTIFAVFRPTMNFMYNVTVAALLWWGGGSVLSNIVTFGVLYAFIGYAQQFFQPIQDIADKYQIMQSAMAASERIFQVIDTPAEVLDTALPAVLPDAVTGEIRFEHVWFAYEGDNWVLKDVDFTVAPGQSVAFVGATGAGKSSIVNLLGRFYDVQRGRVLLDGQDVSAVEQQNLRRKIGVVQQDVFLFAGNIRDNIKLGDPIPDEVVEAAARHVHAADFIERLPGKYDEPVQERGSTFSAGQRQLVAFARVLAHDPAILVLDEATASIDTETEGLIQQALERVSHGRTTLIVAHRLSTIRNCDQILVMNHGRIVERGTHEELLHRRGLYWDLYRLQYRESEQPLGEVGTN
ncbi:MAG: ABC transporter ATP-binding protein [Thermaerobacter sp.]|nr:ABC transporter ATP-binding protein [Thermaerobacter sp.]